VFTYVKLKNFLSFGDVTFNLKRTAKKAKPFVAIYGENGSGKSNFVKSIDFLYRTLTSFATAKKTESITELVKQEEDQTPVEIIERILREGNIEHYMSSCRMVDCDDPTELEFGFTLDGYEGIYKVSFAEKIINESLYYFTGKQRGYIFDISADDQDTISHKFWGGLFLNAKAEEELLNEIQKFWGKHTFLGIVIQQISERNYSYIRKSLSEYLLNVINLFLDTTVISKTSNSFNTGVINGKPNNVLRDLQSGKISEKQLPLLERSERILKDFFTQTYADIKDVVYEREITPAGAIRYQLYVDKMIAGKVRRINFKNESAGTQQILEIVRMLLGLFCGVTVVYDEIDDGIHDVLLCNIISSLKNEINGQLIITTHNTMLLEEIDPRSAYVICVDYLGNKEIRCMADFSIQNSNNARIKYLKGLFGGTPYIEGIDYDTIVHEIEGKKEES
jgi:AAA15 family ATPase/GTPase